MAIPKTGAVSLDGAYRDLFPTIHSIETKQMNARRLRDVCLKPNQISLGDLRGRAVGLQAWNAGTTSGFNVPGRCHVEVVNGGIDTHGYYASGGPQAPIGTQFGDYYRREIAGGYVGTRTAINLGHNFYCNRATTFDCRVNALANIPSADSDAGFWVVCVGYQNGYKSGPSTILLSQRLYEFSDFGYRDFNFSFSTDASYPYTLISLQLINRPGTSASAIYKGYTAELEVTEQ